MDISKHIDINPKIMLSKPIVRGTRIPVELVLRKLGEGATEKELCEAYPRLTPENIREMYKIEREIAFYRENIGTFGYIAEQLGLSKTELIKALRVNNTEPDFSDETVLEESQ
ncbi:MAG: DUF433 domain-containing protein [Desulfococcaceae bacterium]